MTSAVEEALAPLPAGYRALFDRLVAAVEHDERIRGVWLSGSVARGEADAGSDLDVLLAVRDDDLSGFADGWQDWLAALTPTLIAKPLTFAPGSFYSLTTTHERLDVVVEPVSRVTSDTPYRTRLVVLDRDGLDARVPVRQPEAGPDPERMTALVEEFFRLVAVSTPAVLVRGDHLLGVEGVRAQHRMLYDLCVEGNRPLPTTGVKQWSAKLSAEQREALEGLLPGPTADRASFVAEMSTMVAAWRRVGREVLDRHGVTWPEELDRAVVDRFEAVAAGRD